MTIIRIAKKTQPYTMVSNDTIRDERLSWKARGILCYLLSLPDDWEIYVSELINHSPDGDTSLRSGLQELQTLGYLSRAQTRDKHGRISGYEYTAYERPIEQTQDNEDVEEPTISPEPTLGESICGKSRCGKPVNTNNDLTNNDLTNNDLKNTDSRVLERESTHQEMITAISEITEMDIKLKRNLGRILVASQELRQAGYSPDDVRRFVELWHRDWRYQKNNSPPTLVVLLNEIGRVKTQRRRADEFADVILH